MEKLSVINQQFIKAAQENQLDELKNLLSQGADIHSNDDYALRFSAHFGHLEIVKFLVTQGANIHAGDDKALKYSAQNGRLKVVKFLITHGADIHANNDAALRSAASCGHLEIVKFLISHGANIHASNDYALREAAGKENDDVWQVLSIFIQEEKLLVAASVSMPVLACHKTNHCQQQKLNAQKYKFKKI